MTTFQTLELLIKEKNELDWDAWIYCNKASWNKDPKKTAIHYVTEDEAMEYEEDDDTGNPSLGAELNIEPFMEFQTFNDIVEKNAEDSVDSIIESINYYRKYDTFKV